MDGKPKRNNDFENKLENRSEIMTRTGAKLVLDFYVLLSCQKCSLTAKEKPVRHAPFQDKQMSGDFLTGFEKVFKQLL
jgi:hypothetical protein